MARPSKIDQQIDREGGGKVKVGEAIIEALEAGSYFDDACAAAGIHESTGYDWLSRGRTASGIKNPAKAERPFIEFAEAVEKARAGAVVFAITVIRKAAQGEPAEYDGDGHLVKGERGPQWTAAAWYLERTRPQKFGRRLAVEGGGENAGPEPLDLSSLSKRELDQLERLMKKATAQVDEPSDA